MFGGHGYVKEWGIEQIVRDSRVAMIYEGTNEIQAIDLLVRKVLPDGGATLNALLNDLLADSAWSQPSSSLQANAEALRQVTAELVAVNAADPSKAYWVAGEYLRVTGLVLLQWAADRLAASKACDAFRAAVGCCVSCVGTFHVRIRDEPTSGSAPKVTTKAPVFLLKVPAP